MSRVVEPILFNGSTGSIGSSMPATALPVKSRLESSLTDIQTELKEVSGGHAFVFIHLAGLVRVEDCEKDPALARALNVDGAEKFYHAASAAGCSHFVYVSSAHVYAASKEKLKVGDPLGPRSEYARTKRDAELRLKSLSDGATAGSGPRPSIPVTIARVFSVLPENKRPGYLVTALHERAKNKDFSPIPGLSYVRDFMPSDEICAKLIEWGRHAPAQSQTVNVCTGEGRSIRNIAEMVFYQYEFDVSKLQEAPGRPDDISYMVGEPTPTR